jgi:chaperonin cofactor prefoldin
MSIYNDDDGEYTALEEQLLDNLHDLECKIESLENQNEILREIIYRDEKMCWSVEL